MSEKEKEAIVEEQQQDISELLQIRRDKLSALQAEGNNPFFVNTCDKDISAQEKFKAICEYARACGIIGFEEYMYLTANIEFGEQVDPRRYEA